MKKFNVAFIGVGGIAYGAHLPALKKLENVNVVAFADGNEEILSRLYGHLRAFALYLLAALETVLVLEDTVLLVLILGSIAFPVARTPSGIFGRFG